MEKRKEIDLLIREAMQRHKKRNPIPMLPEGFEDKVMEQIKTKPHHRRADIMPIRILKPILRTAGAAAVIVGLFYLVQLLTPEKNEPRPELIVKTKQQENIKPVVKEKEAKPQNTVMKPDAAPKEKVSARKKPPQHIPAPTIMEISTSIQETSQRMENLREQYEPEDANALYTTEEHPSTATNTSLLAMQEMVQNMNNFKKLYEP